MGKWTHDYLDDVLHAKVSSLVTAAINRATVEKEPTITYENFVRELDTGDSFTTSMVDILVKELADRRTRPGMNDRRLIADRTAKSLRLLATPLRIYRERGSSRNHHFGRRTVNLTEYLTAPPNEMSMEEDDDEFDTMLDRIPAEGARTNSEIYEALGTHAWPSSISTRRVISSPSPPVEATDESTTLLLSPTDSNRSARPWSVSAEPTSYSTTLVRQPSLRRPARSRTVDFNDFTHRRRSTIRESLGSGSSPAETVTEPREGSVSRASQPTRRFFPFSRSRRHESTTSLPWSDVVRSRSTDPGESALHFDIEPGASNGWGILHSISTPDALSPRESPDAAIDESSQNTAREAHEDLARGSGVSTPYYYDRTITTEPAADDEQRHSVGESGSYPTPGSTENENIS